MNVPYTVRRVVALLLLMFAGAIVAMGGKMYLEPRPQADTASSPTVEIPVQLQLTFPGSVWTPEKEAHMQERSALATEWLRSIGYPAPEAVFVTAQSPVCGDTFIGVNAIYCLEDGKTYFTIEVLEQIATSLSDKIGVDSIIGHEFFHSVQHANGSSSDEEGWLEYQADCGSGVYVRWLSDHGHVTVDQSDVDMFENRFVQDVGDATSSGNFEHGLVIHRARWLDTGFRSGDITACAMPDKGLLLAVRN